MRLVLDTNVVVSALLWGGMPYRLLQQTVDGELTGSALHSFWRYEKKVFQKYNVKLTPLIIHAAQRIGEDNGRIV